MTKPLWMLPPGCEILLGPAEAADSITVALLDAVEPEHAPRARNASEQLLFHHLYETLIIVNCLDKVQPGLAESWRREERGRCWTFELREDARFWDGTPVTAHDVARSWERAADESMTLNAGIDSYSAAGIDSLAVGGDRVLNVYFKHMHRKVPRALSASAFAVAKPSWASRWPLGSGPYRIVTSERRFAGIAKRTITVHPAYGAERPVVRFLETSMYDARDLLEGGIDVMITTDPAVIEYATSRPQFTTVPLPWDRAYVLLSTSRVEKLRWGGKLGTISPDLSERLARDAVRGDARGYRPPSWWDDLHNECYELSAAVSDFPPVPEGPYSLSDLRRILYDSNDPIARDLAERIVALAATDPTVSPEARAIAFAVPGLGSDAPGVIAEGVTEGELLSSLLNGSDFAYIISIPRRPPDPCAEARKLISSAQWLANLGDDFSKALIPLVDTRLHVIAASGKIGLIADWYGNILLVNVMPQGR
ncbi:MAG: hypothetical protein GTO29_14580 [Candidatus Latescibacteria bacterium]|nr:hypothetical protein [Candidatus Latescibacterota bacterium]NIO57375.1 hypothetical protein [Candidatus Latescibacterota bacterium]